MHRRHPTIVVPDLGALDHAWDLLGAWQIQLTLGQRERGAATLHFTSWDAAELHLADEAPAEAHQLRRTAPIVRSPAGGGALAMQLIGATLGPLALTLWPGELHLSSVPENPNALEAIGRRGAAYYHAKYPETPA